MGNMIGPTIVGVAALACATGAIAGRPNGDVGRQASAAAGAPVVVADPAIVRLGGSASVTVRGLVGRRLEVRLVGATTPAGVPLGWRPLRPRGRGLAWKPADAGSSRHLPDRGAGRRRATSREVGELDAPCLRSGDAFPPLVRQARRCREMVGADRYRPCTVDRAQTLAPARLRPARPAAPPTARGRLLAGRAPRRRRPPRHVRHCRPQRLRRPLVPARSDVAALSKSSSSSSSSRSFNAVLGLRQEGKAAAAVAALQKMMIVKARVRRTGAGRAARRAARPRRRRLARSRRRRPRRRPPRRALRSRSPSRR